MGNQAQVVYTDGLKERLDRLSRRPKYLPPQVDWMYAPGGASDIEALREIRHILAMVRNYETAIHYRNAVKTLFKLSQHENLSSYVREVAKSSLDYMNDYEGLGMICKYAWKSIQPQNAASLVLRPWQAVGEFHAVLTYDVGQKLLTDRWSIDLPPNFIFTHDGDLITKQAYYNRYKYSVLSAPLEDIKKYGLGNQLGQALCMASRMNSEELVKLMYFENITGW